MVAKTPKQAAVSIGGVSINPMAVYSASDCMVILGGVTRTTLAKYVESRGFPLKPVGQGRAIGQEVLDWLKAQRPQKRAHSRSPKKSQIDD